MKTINAFNNFLRTAKIFILRYSIFNCVLFFVACDFTLIKEIDIKFPDRLPGLSVTAILNGNFGVFDIRLIDQSYIRTKEIICDGEIRLFEDGTLILSIPGPFDMSKEITDRGWGWNMGRNGYRWIRGGISTHPGSVYRLEVDVEGYPMAVSSSVMPKAPVVSAKMDTSVQVSKKNVKEISNAGYWLAQMNLIWNENYPDRYWPLSVSVDASDVNNHFALDVIYINTDDYRAFSMGIGSSDVSILLSEGMEGEFLNNEHVDMYLFPMLITKNLKDVSNNFYVAVVDISDHPTHDNLYLEEDQNLEKIITQHVLILHVRNITPATYQYFRSLSSQFDDTGVFSEQPVNVVSNIEGGYGSFAVYNTTDITLLEWETIEYREKEE